tara:strand:- start:190 stop:291 length:102 start_codon:yes stop_codon:yes gene_type:complete
MNSDLEDIFKALDEFDEPNLTDHWDAIGWKNEN